MREQHLSDEAIAAFADDVLPKGARERARRHTTVCPECGHAVAVQREAVWALRAAPAPALPIGLLDRLREVPSTTPIRHVPSTFDEHGNAMFSTVAGPAAAFVPMQHPPEPRQRHWAKPVAFTAASLAAAGVVTGMVLTSGGVHAVAHHPAHIQPASVQLPANSH